MYNFDENTPLAALTVGQFFELYEQKKTNKKPIVKEEPKIDRVGITYKEPSNKPSCNIQLTSGQLIQPS